MIALATIQSLAARCGFELAGAAPAEHLPEAGFYLDWVRGGMAGNMRYLTDHRAALREDPRKLLPEARSVICVGKLYHQPLPLSVEFEEPDRGWIARYAWGRDYHDVIREGLENLAGMLETVSGGTFASRICVDTAPVLERALARRAGLGWIGKNGCLINQQQGSWFLLGELLTPLEVEHASPPPDRCGTCTRCIEACPTNAIVPAAGPGYTVDARLCISYLTIELRGQIPEPLRRATGSHIYGCDICQDVCPWNRKAPFTGDSAFAPRHFAPPLEELEGMDAAGFRERFGGSAVLRARHAGFLRNVAVAMGNSGLVQYREPLRRLAAKENEDVADHARWGLIQLGEATLNSPAADGAAPGDESPDSDLSKMK